jgi:hypothetical protein
MGENWEKLWGESVWHARGLVARRPWRGVWGGVVPEGYDPEGIVNEAVAEMFNGKCRLKADYTAEELKYELMRLVYNQVHRYHRRKETRVTWNAEDLTPWAMREEGRSIMEWVPGTDETPAEQAIRHEAQARFREFVAECSAFLEGEPELRDLFLCLCQGCEKREDLAARLGIDVQTVTNRRKKLDRRLEEFGEKVPGWPKEFIEEMQRL